MSGAIGMDRVKIGEFCWRHRIRKLSVFGSALRGEGGADSDLDLLVEFEPDAIVGLVDLAGMELELSDLLGRRVDLRTPSELSRYFRNRVLAEAEPQYVRG
ncbi:MAG TPA: nucleotidyltransferase family protein [Phycisphaerae bacterium]|nr:nucleotidyltransferase family protein [Phycisphaerae bacterium]